MHLCLELIISLACKLGLPRVEGDHLRFFFASFADFEFMFMVIEVLLQVWVSVSSLKVLEKPSLECAEVLVLL